MEEWDKVGVLWGKLGGGGGSSYAFSIRPGSEGERDGCDTEDGGYRAGRDGQFGRGDGEVQREFHDRAVGGWVVLVEGEGGGGVVVDEG